MVLFNKKKGSDQEPTGFSFINNFDSKRKPVSKIQHSIKHL